MLNLRQEKCDKSIKLLPIMINKVFFMELHTHNMKLNKTLWNKNQILCGSHLLFRTFLDKKTFFIIIYYPSINMVHYAFFPWAYIDINMNTA